jgi:hypothetical protein
MSEAMNLRVKASLLVLVLSRLSAFGAADWRDECNVIVTNKVVELKAAQDLSLLLRGRYDRQARQSLSIMNNGRFSYMVETRGEGSRQPAWSATFRYSRGTNTWLRTAGMFNCSTNWNKVNLVVPGS